MLLDQRGVLPRVNDAMIAGVETEIGMTAGVHVTSVIVVLRANTGKTATQSLTITCRFGGIVV